jgi:hypothetical protein
MTARSVPQVVSSRIRERQTCASTASMPNARPWRRGQAPKPHGGAPKAQGLTVAIAVAAPSPVPSFVPPVNLNSTGADVPINAFATARIYTSLTDVTAGHQGNRQGHEQQNCQSNGQQKPQHGTVLRFRTLREGFATCRCRGVAPWPPITVIGIPFYSVP